MVEERLRKLRERLQRREKRVRADRRARERRIERDEPEGVRERATVASEEAGELAKDAKELLATELGVSTEESEGIIKRGREFLERGKGQLSQFDVDGDGDTDLLSSLDPVEDEEMDTGDPDTGGAGPVRKTVPREPDETTFDVEDGDTTVNVNLDLEHAPTCETERPVVERTGGGGGGGTTDDGPDDLLGGAEENFLSGDSDPLLGGDEGEFDPFELDPLSEKSE